MPGGLWPAPGLFIWMVPVVVAPPCQTMVTVEYVEPPER